MLCYAWNVLAVKDDVMKVGSDDYDDASCSVLDAAVWGTAKIGMSHDDFAEAIGQPYTVSIPIDWEDSLPGNVLIIDADGKNELQGGPHKLFLLEDNKTVVFVSLWKIPTDS